jgi:hypothetical protein
MQSFRRKLRGDIVFTRDTPGWLRESGGLDAREGGRDGKKR